MKLENWNVAQTESCVEENSIVSKITLTTYDYFDTKKFIEWIKAYDTEFDMDEYETAIEIHKRETADRDFFRGRSPEQIYEMCNELFNELRIKKGTASSIAIRKRLNIGIDILRGYDVYWTPPRPDNIITEDWSDKIKPVEETVAETTPENDKTTKTEDPYKDLPYEGKMVGSVYRRPRDE